MLIVLFYIICRYCALEIWIFSAQELCHSFVFFVTLFQFLLEFSNLISQIFVLS
ncbi:hypothetical protein HanXRQr2_Chr15g0718721 [Helianthus annuus]|uniref:Uncharacterized protein n=1 Tax=Helianthus annuus TaxID=4232 RepID=A0A9K3E4B1_HELAN|nr:hypothetical protein HanXRQr2_Chr15g0718721 [Helianthus annuus]KAJ0833362.1 hypothetical protein HanPSC8_Chr15g0689531 [Helianthus annuus]